MDFQDGCTQMHVVQKKKSLQREELTPRILAPLVHVYVFEKERTNERKHRNSEMRMPRQARDEERAECDNEEAL
jgi:hypothetical protein